MNDALDDFSTIDPVAAQLVKLRFFAGLTTSEAAKVLGMSVRSAHDLWAYARSWLHRELRADKFPHFLPSWHADDALGIEGAQGRWIRTMNEREIFNAARQKENAVDQAAWAPSSWPSRPSL